MISRWSDCVRLPLFVRNGFFAAMTSADEQSNPPPRRTLRNVVLILAAVVVAVVVFNLFHSDGPFPRETATFVGNESCISCHQPQAATYHLTAHAKTSSQADVDSVHGDFDVGSNVLLTANPDLHFRMESRDGKFFETAVLQTSPTEVLTRTESIDIVVGSGRKGQTFLYWDDDGLFQLPVSYWAEQQKWVNSPGFIDGEAKFDRPIQRRCIECHATSFEWHGPPENHFAKESLVLGISCEKCHGPGSEHVARYRSDSPPRSVAEAAILNPAKLTRERQIDLCALCHAGLGHARTPPLSYVPGDDLADHLRFPRQAPGAHIDVHASQVQLLERSRCFRSSPEMSCTTCHDVHQPQRDLASFAARCLSCHKVEDCGEFPRKRNLIATKCVSCHMPLEQTAQIVIQGRSGGTMQPQVRNHRIAIYPDDADDESQ